jgi:Uma2 family endonuclease
VAIEITRRLFDVEDYHKMAKAGILLENDRVELIDGEVVAMTPIGPRHNAAVNRATRTLVNAVGERAIVQVQGSVRLGRYDEPQPDIILLRPRDDFYASHLPGPADVLLIIEFADSSLDYDRSVKAPVYAEAAVREYWIVDLAARMVICHLDPRKGVYQAIHEIRPGESKAPQALSGCPIAIDDLLVD